MRNGSRNGRRAAIGVGLGWALALIGLFGLGLGLGRAVPDPERLLEAADKARFLEAESYELRVEATRTPLSPGEEGEEGVEEALLRVLSKRFPEGFRTRLEILAPEALAGTVWLVVGEDVFFWKPGLEQPLRFGGQQKLFGDVSVIEAARLELFGNYRVLRQEAAPEGLRLELEARRSELVYPFITLWLTPDGEPWSLLLKSLSGEPLKRLVYLQYGAVQGDRLATEFIVEDLLFKGSQTHIRITETLLRPLGDELFDPQSLGKEEFS